MKRKRVRAKLGLAKCQTKAGRRAQRMLAKLIKEKHLADQSRVYEVESCRTRTVELASTNNIGNEKNKLLFMLALDLLPNYKKVVEPTAFVPLEKLDPHVILKYTAHPKVDKPTERDSPQNVEPINVVSESEEEVVFLSDFPSLRNSCSHEEMFDLPFPTPPSSDVESPVNFRDIHDHPDTKSFLESYIAGIRALTKPGGPVFKRKWCDDMLRTRKSSRRLSTMKA